MTDMTSPETSTANSNTANSNNHSKEDKAGKRARRRNALLILGGLALAAMLVWAFQPKPVPADFAMAEIGPLEVTLDEEGETRVRERYVVSAPLAGRVLRIELEPGDPVVGGETVLATFQPSAPILLDARSRAEAEGKKRAAEAGLGQARAELERARAELAYAESELKRVGRLAADEIVSTEKLDSAELQVNTRRRAVEAAEFRVDTSRHELEVAKAALMHTAGGSESVDREPMTLTSPIDGVVLSRLRESESVVAAGEPLLEVADPSRLEIVSDFLSTDAVRIAPGSPVYIEQWGGDTRLEATVRRVEPSGFTKISALGVEEQRVNVIIDFADPREAWEALGDGYRVEVQVVIWRGDEVTKVPTSALFRHETGWAVFTVEDDTAHLVPVEIGHRNSLEAEVLSGIEVGTMLLVHPSDEVTDGIAVEERTTG